MPALYNDEAGAQGRAKKLRLLAVADNVEPRLYNSSVVDWLAPVDLIISCGDLPPDYLDYVVSTLNTRLLHVLGNHCCAQHDPVTNRCKPSAYPGAYNLNGRAVEAEGLLIAGIEGSPRYNGGPHQYTEQQVMYNLLRLIPSLLLNKAQTGRYLDILVTHTPPRGIHDMEDVAHRGFSSFIPFLERFKPTIMLHGHTHRYDPLAPMRSRYGETEIINTYGHVMLELERDGLGWKIADKGEVPSGQRTAVSS